MMGMLLVAWPNPQSKGAIKIFFEVESIKYQVSSNDLNLYPRSLKCAKNFGST